MNDEWSFAQTLRHLVFITDAWASRTVLDEPMPYHPLGLPQSWYPPAEAGKTRHRPDRAARLRQILAARADRMAVMRRILAGLTNADLGRGCQRSPAPGYPEEERAVAECIAVVMDEEIEHYRLRSAIWRCWKHDRRPGSERSVLCWWTLEAFCVLALTTGLRLGGNSIGPRYTI